MGGVVGMSVSTTGETNHRNPILPERQGYQHYQATDQRATGDTTTVHRSTTLTTTTTTVANTISSRQTLGVEAANVGLAHLALVIQAKEAELGHKGDRDVGVVRVRTRLSKGVGKQAEGGFGWFGKV